MRNGTPRPASCAPSSTRSAARTDTRAPGGARAVFHFPTQRGKEKRSGRSRQALEEGRSPGGSRTTCRFLPVRQANQIVGDRDRDRVDAVDEDRHLLAGRAGAIRSLQVQLPLYDRQVPAGGEGNWGG